MAQFREFPAVLVPCPRCNWTTEFELGDKTDYVTGKEYLCDECEALLRLTHEPSGILQATFIRASVSACGSGNCDE